MEDAFMQIANYGFPIVVTVYLLVRMECKIEKLAESINELNESIIKIGQNKK